jgi:transglutaminase-like putative cysteine protease
VIRRLAIVGGVVLVMLAASSRAQAAPPPWLRQVAAEPLGSDDPAAVILLDQIDATVTSDGKLRATRRYAMRLRDREGRSAAAIREVYLTDSGKIRSIRGWLIRASGEARDIGNANVADLAIVDNDVYNEVRVRALNVTDEIAPGDVFGAEIESEERLLFAQLEWSLQDRWPVRIARRTLTLPPGWTAKSLTFNRASIEPQTANRTLAWEVRNLGEIPIEEWMPPLSDLAPRLAISLFGTAATPAPGQFATWTDVSTWLEALVPHGGKPTDAVARKAADLVTSSTSELEQIRAIGRFVQRVQYVSIQTGLGRGGGYQPRPAEMVLQRNYGDCKDKANLMRALLAAIGIRSHMVSVFSGDRNYVREQWPSPQQFNHAIVAIALTKPTSTPSVMELPALGRLMFFDPTDPFTPPGELPPYEQGSLALIEAGQAGTLRRLPLADARTHQLTRIVDGRVGPAGDLTLRITEDARGAEASVRRGLFGALDASGYQERVQRRIAATIPGARVVHVTADTASTTPNFVVTTEMTAAGYAQPMGRLLLIKPPLDVGERMQTPAGRTRKTPVLIEPRVVNETVTLEIPQGFTIDELPPGASIDSAFGHYSLSYTADGSRVTVRRNLDLPLKTIPAGDYQAARQFFEQVRAADATPIVLKR